MGDRTTQEHHFLHARQVNIADEFTLTTNVAGVLLTRQPRPNPFWGHANHSARPCIPGVHADDMNSQNVVASTLGSAAPARTCEDAGATPALRGALRGNRRTFFAQAFRVLVF